MTASAEQSPIERLTPFIGTWNVEARFPGHEDAITGTKTFTWGPGNEWVIERWEDRHPDFPDAMTVIGVDERRNAYLQHYFDSRAVARIYEMRFEDGAWDLIRTTADFSELGFAQRYSGRFSDDLTTIRGGWESSRDGTTWNHDFELVYTRAR